MRACGIVCLLVAICGPAIAQTGSFLTSDGINRAPAAVLHCVGPGNVAIPCGTATQPVSVTAGPASGNLVSRSASVPAAQSTQLFPANTGRHSLTLQAPVGNAIWVNFLGGVAAPNGTDCVQLSAGTLYESGQFVTRSAVTVYAPVSVTIAAWEG